MPLINVKLIEGIFSDDQKHDIIERLTDAHGLGRGREHARRHLVRGREGQERGLGDRRKPDDHRCRMPPRRRPTRRLASPEQSANRPRCR
jgi:Tautomerase enzyme